MAWYLLSLFYLNSTNKTCNYLVENIMTTKWKALEKLKVDFIIYSYYFLRGI